VIFRIALASESALMVSFDERIDPAVNNHVLHLADAVASARIPGVLDIVPAYRSLAIYFDPLKTDRSTLIDILQKHAGESLSPVGESPRIVRIPVQYGADFGPDLETVASFAGIATSDVIELHTKPIYRVFMLGFMPGFAYMGSVDPRIAAPRRSSPRPRVLAGSVGIAGQQTGVYPSDSPGGWQIIGRTSVKPFDLSRDDPFLFRPGDGVQFYPVAGSDRGQSGV
jgi:KipI family sensor histidine kinase inhibitor